MDTEGGIFWQLELGYNDTVERNAPFFGSSPQMHAPKGTGSSWNDSVIIIR